MEEKLIPIHSSLDLAIADSIINSAIKIYADKGILPLAIAALDAGGPTWSAHRGSSRRRHPGQSLARSLAGPPWSARQSILRTLVLSLLYRAGLAGTP